MLVLTSVSVRTRLDLARFGFLATVAEPIRFPALGQRNDQM